MKIVNYQVEYAVPFGVVWNKYSLGYTARLREARYVAKELKTDYPHYKVRIQKHTQETVK